MLQKSNHTLINPQTGSLAFRIYSVKDENSFENIQRLNYYTLILVERGEGRLKADFSEYSYDACSLMSFAPFQPFLLIGKIEATIIHFHPDFFCIHKHHSEVACHGVLFNNIYDPPLLSVDDKSKVKMLTLADQMKDELQESGIAQAESLVSYLKLFLIAASRLKVDQMPEQKKAAIPDEGPFVLQNLKDSIEKYYKSKHSPSEYADMLAISSKALSRITKEHFNKTLSELIAERIIIEAKRELYLTNKPVKEIAYDLGYDDEYYFSRFFKKNANVSPHGYRQSVGYDKASTL